MADAPDQSGQDGAAPATADAYCRDVEAYLCRKNDGHLIRLVGPAFGMVQRWAGDGIPIRVVFRGVDRYFERYYRKGPRRRPVRLEFCEADVLDVYDEWRRAVGVVAAAPSGEPDQDVEEATAAPTRRRGLGAHIDRVLERLNDLRAGAPLPAPLAEAIPRTVQELEAMKAQAGHTRGDAKAALVERLSALDVAFIDAARSSCADEVLAAIRRQTDLDLAPFRSRMPVADFERARTLSEGRLIRERVNAPVIAFE